ncbi:MAG: GNAT family N-acetyltransferase [Ignavibacteriae bacterium]|nr:GNAT family N-acetyltransferase [Ignavibacteriota bacterium]
MQNIEIKRVTLNNIYQLQKIGKQTFFETFAESNTEENMLKYLEQDFSLIKLTAEIENKDSEFYFAESGNNKVGYLKINFGKSQTEIHEDESIEIERIYVLKEFHGKNVGQKLYEKAIEIANKRKAKYIWLGVWEKNLRAIKFYKKNGFVEFGEHTFKLGSDEQLDIMMKLEFAK